MKTTLYYCLSKLLIACLVAGFCCCCTYRLPKRSPKTIEQAQKWYYKASAAEMRRAYRVRKHSGHP